MRQNCSHQQKQNLKSCHSLYIFILHYQDCEKCEKCIVLPYEKIHTILLLYKMISGSIS